MVQCDTWHSLQLFFHQPAALLVFNKCARKPNISAAAARWWRCTVKSFHSLTVPLFLCESVCSPGSLCLINHAFAIISPRQICMRKLRASIFILFFFTIPVLDSVCHCVCAWSATCLYIREWEWFRYAGPPSSSWQEVVSLTWQERIQETWQQATRHQKSLLLCINC